MTDWQIIEAAQADTIDEALAPLMQRHGIQSGDVAAQCFSDIDDGIWEQMHGSERIAKLEEWLAVEAAIEPELFA